MLNPRPLALLLAAALSAFAFDFSSLKPEGYVSDFARVIDTAAKVELERYCQALEDKTGVQVALVTVATIENEPVSDVANVIYRAWGIGQKKSNEGVLLLLAIRERKSRLEVGYGLESVLPDGTAGDVLRAMRPALRENHYGDAFIAAAKSIGDRIVAAKQAEGTLPPMRASRQRSPESGIPLEVIFFFCFFLLTMYLASRSRQYGYAARRGRGGVYPIFFPGVGGGSSGNFPRSGGGFGGMSDSGGGFGGFGGGDSGGGGASSDW